MCSGCMQAPQPGARSVQAFNSVGNAFVVDTKFQEGRPPMFICGNDAKAKESVSANLNDFGPGTGDLGAVEGARAMEPRRILWCIPGFAQPVDTCAQTAETLMARLPGH